MKPSLLTCLLASGLLISSVACSPSSSSNTTSSNGASSSSSSSSGASSSSSSSGGTSSGGTSSSGGSTLTCTQDEDCASGRCNAGTCDPLEFDWYSRAQDAWATPGARTSATCPPDGSPGTVWGTDAFTADSSVCTAAVHAGLITLAAGGTVTLEVRGARDWYAGTTRNGITTLSYGPYSGTFVFLPVGACANDARGGDETDVDCGGACGGCPEGRACMATTDCASAMCTDGTCSLPPCQDRVRNGNETDVDCGGDTCSPCFAGQACNQPGDCYTDICTANVCQPPLCQNTVKDPLETDVDCGGATSTCQPCAYGKTCMVDADCASGTCNGGMCGTADCTDMERNGLETGVDCGGQACAACGMGEPCVVASDCVSRTCTAGMCAVTDACINGVKDGMETDVDCGGTCGPCGGQAACSVAEDCLSMTCTAMQCTTPAGSDVRVYAMRQRLGHAFLVHCDAMSDMGGGLWGTGYYTDDSDICRAARHAGLLQDGMGGDVTVVVAAGRHAYRGSIANGITSSFYGSYSGSFRFDPPGACANGMRDMDETDVDCGGPCAACAPGAACGVEADCSSMVCVNGRCG